MHKKTKERKWTTMNFIRKFQKRRQIEKKYGELKNIGNFSITIPDREKILLFDNEEYEEKGQLLYHVINKEDEGEYIQLVEFILYDPSIRKHGIGKKLISELVEYAKNNNMKKIDVYPSPTGEEAVSRDVLYQIYGRLGFSFTDGGSETIKHMEMLIR